MRKYRFGASSAAHRYCAADVGDLNQSTSSVAEDYRQELSHRSIFGKRGACTQCAYEAEEEAVNKSDLCIDISRSAC